MWRSDVTIVLQLRIASAPVRRQGFARCARRLTPPLTATAAPAQQVVSSRLTRLLRSSTTGSNTKFLTTPLISTPISAMITCAAVVLTPGMVTSRSTTARKGFSATRVLPRAGGRVQGNTMRTTDKQPGMTSNSLASSASSISWFKRRFGQRYGRLWRIAYRFYSWCDRQ